MVSLVVKGLNNSPMHTEQKELSNQFCPSVSLYASLYASLLVFPMKVLK